MVYFYYINGKYGLFPMMMRTSPTLEGIRKKAYSDLVSKKYEHEFTVNFYDGDIAFDKEKYAYNPITKRKITGRYIGDVLMQYEGYSHERPEWFTRAYPSSGSILLSNGELAKYSNQKRK